MVNCKMFENLILIDDSLGVTSLTSLTDHTCAHVPKFYIHSNNEGSPPFGSPHTSRISCFFGHFWILLE